MLNRKPYHDARRWLQMLALSILNFSNAVGYVTLNGVSECAAGYYHRSVTSIL